jgi:hypothetical protein
VFICSGCLEWDIKPEYHGWWAQIHKGVDDMDGCMDACVANGQCIALDWNYAEESCWIFDHGGPVPTGPEANIVHMALTRTTVRVS